MADNDRVLLLEPKTKARWSEIPLGDLDAPKYWVSIGLQDELLRVRLTPSFERRFCAEFLTSLEEPVQIEIDPLVHLHACRHGEVVFLQITELHLSLVACVFKVKSGHFEGWATNCLLR